MKTKLLLILFLFSIAAAFNSCVDEIVVADKKNKTGKIVIESVPVGAQIYLLGTKTDKITPDSLVDLETGEYQITLKKQNYADSTIDVKVYDKLTTTKTVLLRSISNTGILVIQSFPDSANIFLSGVNTRKTTPYSFNLESSLYVVTLKKSGYADTTFNAVVEKGKEDSINVVLRKLLPPGSIFLESKPAGANIFLGNTNTNKFTPDSITNLNAGAYQITLRLNNYVDTTFSVSIISGKQISKNITLTEAVNTGNVFLESEPIGAEIFLSGKTTGKTTPDTISNLEEGNHQFTLKLNGYKDTTFNVSVTKNQTLNKKVTLTKEVTTGNVFLESEPNGAKIFLSGNNTNKITPDTISNLEVGNHQFTLKLNGYKDTTFNVSVTKNQTLNKKVTLTKEVTTGNVFLESEPNGAKIFLSGNNTNKTTPDTISNLEEGSYQFTLKLNGYNDTTFNVSVTKNQTSNKKITLTKEITTGSLTLTSQPSGADIFLNDKDTDEKTPKTFTELNPGSYNITLKLKDYKDTTFTVDIKKGQLTTKNIILTEKDSVEVDKLSYQYVGFFFVNTRFSFSFNQDVFLDKVEIHKKGNSDIQTFQFDETKEIKKDKTTSVDYPGRVTGTYVLTFYGKKSKGTKTDFTIENEIEIP